MIHEEWKVIPEFPNYEISDLGRVYNLDIDHMMATSRGTFGHLKIGLKDDWSKIRYSRSVAQLVGEAFVEPPNILCDHIVILDGKLSNVIADNLVWRPRWYAWKYSRQLKTRQPLEYTTIPVVNITTGDIYESIVDAGMTEGLLYNDIWRSIQTGVAIFPYKAVFVII